MKSCSKCKQNKKLEEFSTSKYHNSGYMSQCKVCRADNEKERRKNPEVKNKIKVYKQKPENRTRTKDLALQRIFGINIENFNEMFEKQNGKCAICNNEEIVKNKRTLAVDHCHVTGKVRGLLCTTCNQGLGHFFDNITNLENAIKYLQENNK